MDLVEVLLERAVFVPALAGTAAVKKLESEQGEKIQALANYLESLPDPKEVAAEELEERLHVL